MSEPTYSEVDGFDPLARFVYLLLDEMSLAELESLDERANNLLRWNPILAEEVKKMEEKLSIFDQYVTMERVFRKTKKTEAFLYGLFYFGKRPKVFVDLVIEVFMGRSDDLFIAEEIKDNLMWNLSVDLVTKLRA